MNFASYMRYGEDQVQQFKWGTLPPSCSGHGSCLVRIDSHEKGSWTYANEAPAPAPAPLRFKTGGEGAGDAAEVSGGDAGAAAGAGVDGDFDGDFAAGVLTGDAPATPDVPDDSAAACR